MNYKVTISERTENNLDNIFEYLKNEWSKKVHNNFRKQLIKTISFLSQNPYMFPVSVIKKDIRKCLITKHNAVYYRIKGKDVEIITIHDTRQNPKSLSLLD